ncbi:hypothetical protein M0813_25322 [Anaeramoeba flamelloides]|uniref:PH domain-containing protein n=1 Tax=Anaeramoeba flamelloides TaxID=1746091 RepID=A0ABQ8Y2P3_9EUKA|nr:hypothetical protein M0813_25322 [Anaeramoeba flamelloides]
MTLPLTPTIENNKKPIQTRRRAYTLRTTKRENSKTDGDNSNFSSRLQRLRNKKKEMEKKIKLENSFIKNNQQKDYSNSFTSPNFLLGKNSNHNSNKSTTTTTRNTTTKTTTKNTTPYSNLTTTTTKKPKKDLNSPNNKIHNFNQNKNMRNNKNDNSNYDHNTSKRNQNTKNSNLKKKGFKLQKYSSDVSEEQKNTIEELLTLALLDLETTESNQQEVHKQKDIDKVDESEIMEPKPISKHKLEENLLLNNTINENNINKNYNVKIKNAFHQKIQMNNNIYNNQKNNNNKFKNNNIIENTNNRKFSSNNNNNNDDDDNLNDENNKNEKIQIEKNTKENDYKNEISNEIPDQSLKDTNSANKGSKPNKTNKPIKNKRKNDPQFSMSQDQFEILNFYNTFKISKFQKQIKQIHKNNVFKKTYSDQNKNQTNNNNNNNNLKNYKIISQSKRENILLKSEFKTMFRNLLKKSKKQEHIKVIFSSERFYLGNLKEYFENGMLVSKVKPNGKLQQRLLYLSKDGKSLCWNDQKKKGKHVSIPFAKIEKIFLGRKTQNMKKVKKNINHNLCFSLADSKNIFDFISVNIHIHKFWMKCLTAIKDNSKNVIDSFNI